MKIEGHDDGLPGEEILINISILNKSIKKIELILSESLYLFKALNYELEKGVKAKKLLEFIVDDFKLKNSLALIFKSKIPKKSKDASIYLKAYDNKGTITSQRYSIKILRPRITVSLKKLENNKLTMSIVKKEVHLPTVIESVQFEAVDMRDNMSIPVDVEKYATFDEYLKTLDRIPSIFNFKTAIKGISISSQNPIKLTAYIQYKDNLNNNYTSNMTSLLLVPIETNGNKLEKMIFMFPFFDAKGFDYMFEPLIIA